MEDGPPMFRQDFTCPALLKDLLAFYLYGAFTLSGYASQHILVFTNKPLASSTFARHYSRSLF